MMNFCLPSLLLIIIAKRTDAVPLVRHFEQQLASNACDVQQFGECSTTFAHAFGLEGMPEDAMQFLRLVQQKWLHSVQDFVDTCSAIHQIVQCMGSESEYKACMNVASMMDIGLTKYSATVYVTFSRTVRFDCGEGYKTYHDNWKCITDTWKAKNSTLEGCTKTLIDKIQKDPTHACSYAQEATKCYRDPFEKSCGKEVGYYSCESLTKTFSVTMPQCEITCDRMFDNEVY